MMLLCISNGETKYGCYHLTVGIGYKHNIEGYLFKELSEIRKEKLKKINEKGR